MAERGFYPKAIVKNIPPGDHDPAIKPRIAVLHVAASNADSLHDYFNGPSGGVESHFYIRFDGTVEQYRSIYWQADAQLDANDFAVGIETAGMGDGEWTPAQLASIKALLSWLHTAAGIKLKTCTAWNGEGVGYHTMWGAPSHWTPSVKTCPGPARVKQFKDVLVPWMVKVSAPKPPADSKLRWTSANLDFVRDGDREHIAHLCENSDVLLVQEAKDVRLADVLPAGWVALQDTTSEATMGTAIAYRAETVAAGKLKLHLGSSPFWQGKRVKMLARHIATATMRDRATGQWFYAVSAHMPPTRFAFLQPGMTRRLRKALNGHPHAIVGTDANQPLDRLAKKLGMTANGRGIVGILTGPHLHVYAERVDRWGITHQATDHPSITVQLRHVRKAKP